MGKKIAVISNNNTAVENVHDKLEELNYDFLLASLGNLMNVENFFNVPLSEIEKNGKPRMVSTSCREILDEYLSVHNALDREISGRLIVE